MPGRSRERILKNLEDIFRAAYDRSKQEGDGARMADLDASYQREQLLLEVLLDIRESIDELSEKTHKEGALDKLKMLKKITKPI